MENKKKVLIIDDDPMILEMIHHVLETEGYEPSEATNGALGLEAAIREAPQLIILDIMMPEMSGTEFLKAVRSTAQIQHIPIIICTARPKEGVGETCFQLGANDFISKPLDLRELRDKVKKLLNSSRSDGKNA